MSLACLNVSERGGLWGALQNSLPTYLLKKLGPGYRLNRNKHFGLNRNKHLFGYRRV